MPKNGKPLLDGQRTLDELVLMAVANEILLTKTRSNGGDKYELIIGDQRADCVGRDYREAIKVLRERVGRREFSDARLIYRIEDANERYEVEFTLRGEEGNEILYLFAAPYHTYREVSV